MSVGFGGVNSNFNLKYELLKNELENECHTAACKRVLFPKRNWKRDCRLLVNSKYDWTLILFSYYSKVLLKLCLSLLYLKASLQMEEFSRKFEISLHQNVGSKNQSLSSPFFEKINFKK